MGIKGLGKFLRKKFPQCIRETSLSAYQQQRAVIDTPIFMYRFCAVNPDTCLKMFERQLQVFSSHGIVPTYIFDGIQPASRTNKEGVDLKTNTLDQRRKRKREWKEKANDDTLSVADRMVYETRVRSIPTARHYQELKELLTSRGIAYVDAEADAEKACAKACLDGTADVVFSEDFDVLPFGWTLTTGLGRKKMVEYNLNDILKATKCTHHMFVDFCILCGCDFCPSIGNVGPVRALKLIQAHTDIDTILTYLDRNKYKVPDIFPYAEARKVFQHLDSETPKPSSSSRGFFEFL